MGREIKRVALDFDYPVNSMIWKGYHNPYQALKCKPCGGSGYSPEWRELDRSWYDHEGQGNRWCHAITQDEVDALWNKGRLRDFKDRPTAKAVNKWAAGASLGHDAVNRWICVRARAKRLGYSEERCSTCGGSGELWPSDEYRDLCDNWQPVDPPAGDGYQLWSTTTEGTPMSPVFSQPEELARWLADTGASIFGSQTATYEEWLRFARGPGWAPSMIAVDGRIEPGIKL